jgi:hypothetical protein
MGHTPSQGLKQIKINNTQASYSTNPNYSDKTPKNVRIVLVGANGPAQKGMQIISPVSMPKTTKNNGKKFYNGPESPFLNQLSTPQNFKNTGFR